jgi:hypothetical protein
VLERKKRGTHISITTEHLCKAGIDYLSEKAVLIDASVAGASGDMILSALIDLLHDDEAIVPVAASLLIYDPAVRVKVLDKTADNLSGKHLDIAKDDSVRFDPASLREIVNVLSEELELSPKGKKLASEALEQIFRAESRAHDTPVEELHLHETGSIDTVLDIAGTMYLLEKANVLEDHRFACTSVAVGTGTIETEHGELEVPVPAVAEIIVEHEMPFHKGDAKTETLTPTGAAILAVLAEEYVESTDAFEEEQKGNGFGSRDLGDVPNVVSISIGKLEKPEPEPKAEEAPKEKKTPPEKKPTETEELPMELGKWNQDEVIVIEANVDDVDGEVLGNMIDTLTSDGMALDVVVIPAYGKKNRPCYIVKVISTINGLNAIAEVLIKNLGTLGIRYTTWSRLKAQRETIVTRLEVDGEQYMIRVKLSRGPDGSIVNIKPELDDLATVSKATGIPIRELKPRVILQAHAVTE